MGPERLGLRVLPGSLAICRLEADAAIPPWANYADATLVAVVRTADELTVVCAEERVPPDVIAERGWVALGIIGPLAFEMTGVLASLATPLAEAGISLYAISTYDTDYVLIKRERLSLALAALSDSFVVANDQKQNAHTPL